MTLIRSRKATPSNRLTRFIPLPWLRALFGFVLSLGAPLGWILLQWLAGRNPFAPESFDSLLYIYMSVATGIVFSALGYAIGKREQFITGLALTDELTALYNKRYFKNRLEQEFFRHGRYKQPISLIQIDIDHFKRVNDTWGHQAGDEVLKCVSAVILANCRKNEVAARVGGEEMCIIATDTDEASAAKLAERLRRAIEQSESFWQGQAIHVTASFGVASANLETETPWQIYQRADEALYKAKRDGRNQVCLGSELNKETR